MKRIGLLFLSVLLYATYTNYFTEKDSPLALVETKPIVKNKVVKQVSKIIKPTPVDTQVSEEDSDESSTDGVSYDFAEPLDYTAETFDSNMQDQGQEFQEEMAYNEEPANYEVRCVYASVNEEDVVSSNITEAEANRVAQQVSTADMGCYPSPMGQL